MNIEQANAISMTFFLEKLGIKPQKENNFNAMYLSPIREERTASFHINKRKNTWFDHGIATGGDLVSFVCHYLKSQKEHSTVSDALRFIKNIGGFAPKINPIIYGPFEDENYLILKSAQSLNNKALFNYLGTRGIDLKIGFDHLQMVKVFNKLSDKHITALGFKNDNDGFELRNKAFKGCVGSKYITFKRGTNPDSGAIHVFEGVMDYLTLLTIKKTHRLEEDAIILNSLVCLAKATPYIKDYGYNQVFTWMDNDVAGKKATNELAEFLKTQNALTHKPMNKVYDTAKDLNAWHMNNLNLKF